MLVVKLPQPPLIGQDVLLQQPAILSSGVRMWMLLERALRIRRMLVGISLHPALGELIPGDRRGFSAYHTQANPRLSKID
jgi:hypothetical protein